MSTMHGILIIILSSHMKEVEPRMAVWLMVEQGFELGLLDPGSCDFLSFECHRLHPAPHALIWPSRDSVSSNAGWPPHLPLR